MPVIQINTDNTRIRLFEQNEKTSYDAMNAISGAVPTDSGYDHLINLALAMMGEVGTSPRPLGFKAYFSGNQVTIGKGIVVRSDGIFKFSGGTYTVNAAAQSGIYEIELSTLYDSPVSKDYINILTETISTAVGSSRKNFQIKLYENYTNSLTPPSPTAGRLKLIDYVTTAPGGNIQTISNPIVAYDTQNAKVPLGCVIYAFHPSYAPLSGVVNPDGFMLADGVTVPSGYALSGWVLPNLVDGSYIEGAYTPNLANTGNNDKTLSTSEMPLHSHTMSGSGSPISVVTDVMMAGGATSPGYVAVTLQSGATNTIKQDPGLALYQFKQNVIVTIGGNTGNAGSGTPFDMRTKRKQGIPLIRVN